MTIPELDLLDFKRRVLGAYARARAADDPRAAFDDWVAERDALFGTHPQSALPPEHRSSFAGLDYFPYDPAARVLGEVRPAPREHHELPSSDGGTMSFDRIAEVVFRLGGESCSLELYWLTGYGGGLFLPFADARAAPRPTARGGTCSTPSRAPTWAAVTGG